MRFDHLGMALLLASCTVRSTPRRPDVFVRLGNDVRTCAGKDGVAHLRLFVNLIDLPPQEVRVVFNDGTTVNLFGTALTINFPAGPGNHTASAFIATQKDPYTTFFSVWNCTF